MADVAASHRALAATIDRADNWLVQFDPYHRLKLGWMDAPKTISAAGPSACLELTPAGTTGQAVVVHNPARPREYFLVEYRRPTGADPNVTEEGVAVWHVREDAAGRLAADDQAISRKPPASAENVPTADIRSAATIARDDVATPVSGFIDRIEWGPNGWLDTKHHETDDLFKTIAMHAVGPRAAERQWIQREHGTAKLMFPGTIASPAGVQLDIGTARETGIYVRFTTKTSAALPAGTPSACSADTVPVTPPPPATIAMSPGCITRPVRAGALTATGHLDFHEPLAVAVKVELSAIDADVEPATITVPAGTRSMPFKVRTRATHSWAHLHVTALVHRPAAAGVPAHVETVDGGVPVLSDRGKLTCRGILRYVELTPRWRSPVYPIGDGRIDIPVSYLRPLTRDQVLGGRLPPVPVDRKFKDVLLQESLQTEIRVQRKPATRP